MPNLLKLGGGLLCGNQLLVGRNVSKEETPLAVIEGLGKY